jgi:polysaccharide chain length determinant protein (PEP-CTERM system associated)
MNFDVKFYLSRFMRRFHYFAIIAVAVSALGITIAYTLPPIYRAQATLLVESPQIPDALAASTVEANVPEILRIIQQRLNTRANILDISRRLGVHDSSLGMTPDQIVADMRSRLQISLPGGRRPSPFVTVSFTAPSAQVSAEVTNDIVTQILQESVALRTAAAGETLQYFDQEVARLTEDLARQSEKILQFKLANKDALPDSLDYRRARQGSQQERLLQIDRELSALKDRRAKLVDLYERTGQVSTDLAGPPRTPEEQKLQQLRDQLSEALVTYAPQNPRIRVIEGQIAALEKSIAAKAAASGESGEQLSPFEIQLADIDGQIGFLETQKAEIETELVSLKTSIDATPINAIQLDVLERDYNAIQTQYNRSVAAQAQAATGDRIESLSKGQRISVIEQATVPGQPDSPPRLLIATGSVAAGIGLGLAFVLLLEFLNRSIQRPADLANRLGIAPFGTVPYIRTQRQSDARRGIITVALLAAMIGIPAGLYAVHVFYLPMDLLIERAMQKVGLAGIVEQFRQSAG